MVPESEEWKKVLSKYWIVYFVDNKSVFSQCRFMKWVSLAEGHKQSHQKTRACSFSHLWDKLFRTFCDYVTSNPLVSLWDYTVSLALFHFIRFPSMTKTPWIQIFILGFIIILSMRLHQSVLQKMNSLPTINEVILLNLRLQEKKLWV